MKNRTPKDLDVLTNYWSEIHIIKASMEKLVKTRLVARQQEIL